MSLLLWVVCFGQVCAGAVYIEDYLPTDIMDETDPLLLQSHQEYGDQLRYGGRVTYISETKFILSLSVPLAVSFLLQFLLSFTSIYAASRLGPAELAAASLGLCTFNVTGLAVYQGVATSLDSLCSQAFGSGKTALVGLYCQRCCAIMTVATVPLAVIWWFASCYLSYVSSDAQLVQMSQTYLRVCLAAAPAMIFFESGKRFLQSQHIFNASTKILMVAAPVNLILNWILVWHPDFGVGFIGAPIAMALVYWFISLSLWAYIYYIDGLQCWGGLSINAFTNWTPMLKLAVPGVVMVEAEYLAFEVLTMLAASFGTEYLAAQSIASNVGALTFQLPFAVSVAITTRIGHFVGMEHIEACRLLTKLSLIVTVLIALINFSVVFFGRKWWISLFTKDPLDVDTILILVAINQISDAANVIAAGILRGQGRQRIGLIWNLACYYLVALPIGYVAAFVLDYKLVGLWWGLMVGVFLLAIAEELCVYVSDWSSIVDSSKEIHDV